MGLLHKARIMRNKFIYDIMESYVEIEEASHDDSVIEKDSDHP